MLEGDFWLIDRRDTATARLGPFGADIGQWLEAHRAEAVLVRPDRYVFGTGTPAELTAAWAAALSGA
ncbi:MAG: hypothetical protein NBV68_08870 [Erythrobacter sp.]|uniref:hypothetical protein n=1 Tax=Erythrobacter sp. TaxID=1042 RepID=UPI0026011D7C|nr:hypothetical protein [Erythrobacter sp.]MCL9999481.1 hypothetical protein [Erythrobacter sp.]